MFFFSARLLPPCMFVYVAAVSIDSICQTIGTAHGCSERPRTPEAEVEAARSDFLARSDGRVARERAAAVKRKKSLVRSSMGGFNAQPRGVTELPVRLAWGEAACLSRMWLAWASSTLGRTAPDSTAQDGQSRRLSIQEAQRESGGSESS